MMKRLTASPGVRILAARAIVAGESADGIA
jgi:hypothetical protein